MFHPQVGKPEWKATIKSTGLVHGHARILSSSHRELPADICLIYSVELADAVWASATPFAWGKPASEKLGYHSTVLSQTPLTV